MSWPRVKLGDFAIINPRVPKGVDETQHVTFVAMASASENGHLLASELRVLSETKKGFTYFDKNDVLLAKITPCFENGKCLRPGQIPTEIGFGSTEFHVIRPDPSKLDGLYLFYLVWNAQFRFLGEKSMSGAAGQKRVGTDFLKELEIPFPPLPEQKRIAAILDKADAIRRKRQQAIQLADDFLRAVFLDMFGDPVTNPKGWPKTALPDVAEKFTDGPFGSNLKSSHYVEEGIRVIRLQNIGVGVLLDGDLAFISEEHYQSLPRNHCQPGDVIIGTLGDPNLRACIIPEQLEFSLNKADCLLFRPSKDKIIAEYICWLLNNPSLVDSASGLVRGQTRGRISLGRLKELEIPLPPLLQQEKFRSVVRKLLDVQAGIGISNEGLTDTFSSISQKAFSGQL